MNDKLEKSTTLVNQGKTKEALNLLEECDTDSWTDQEMVERYNLWGNTLMDMHRTGEAVRVFKRSVELFPDEPILLSNYGLALISLKEYDEALKHLRRAQRLQPKNPNYQYNIGYFFETKGDWGSARERYEAAIRRDAKFAAAHYGVARCEEELGNYDSASRSYDRYIEIDPNRLDVLLAAARAHHLAGHSDTVRYYLDKALELAPDQQNVHFHRMVGSYYTHDEDRFAEEFEWFRKHAPNSPDYFIAASAAGMLRDDAQQGVSMSWQAVKNVMEVMEIDWEKAHFTLCWAMSLFTHLKKDDDVQALYEYALPHGFLPEAFLSDYRLATHERLDEGVQVHLVLDAANSDFAGRFHSGAAPKEERYFRSYVINARDEQEARLMAIRSEWEMSGRDVRVERVVSNRSLVKIHPGLVYISGKILYNQEN